MNLPDPDLQIAFEITLRGARGKMLQAALLDAVTGVPVATLDQELAVVAPPAGLSELAKRGLRGELLFPVPSILTANPHLLGYYRLLLGYSQKEFYTSRGAGGIFKAMEEKGRISKAAQPYLLDLCKAMSKAGNTLLVSMEGEPITKDLLNGLSLMTYGAQLRGASNVTVGQTATARVFNIIKHIVSSHTVASTPNSITVQNATGRMIEIQFTSDPDIAIKETLGSSIANKVAIEVKGGKDGANLHNRVGEAEKSHNKAKLEGFAECWTIINVEPLSTEMRAKIAQESPTTNRWYLLSQIGDPASTSYQDFRDRITSAISI